MGRSEDQLPSGAITPVGGEQKTHYYRCITIHQSPQLRAIPDSTRMMRKPSKHNGQSDYNPLKLEKNPSQLTVSCVTAKR